MAGSPRPSDCSARRFFRPFADILPAIRTSIQRILTTHVGSIPRPASVRARFRARVADQPIDEAELAAACSSQTDAQATR
jgi:hypothetical protein